MRKIKYLVAALLLGAVAVNANPVPLNTAKEVATNFYSQNYKTPVSAMTLAYAEYAPSGQAIYFVFNINNEGGFVIVSAEDAGLPIIGSSDKGHYVVPTTGNNVDFWMKLRKNEITAMRAKSIAATPEITTEWNNYINNITRDAHNVTSSVAQLCSTTWNQSPYYNEYCPGGSLTGCVATAMAQIMKYWNYPWKGTGVKYCYEDEKIYSFQENYGQLCFTPDTSKYDWDEMPNNVTTTNHEVAKLMYDCGVSVDMDYSPSGSGAIVVGGNPSALYSYTEYFNYNANTIDGIMQARYTKANWISTLETELNNKRPIQYQGEDTALLEGHSWVVDGYNTSNDFHMNWGWSGYDDGYFSTTALSVDGYDFDGNLGAIIGIEPSPTAVQQITAAAAINVYPNPSHGEFTFEIPDNLANSQIIIYNMIGQEVSSFMVNVGTTEINLGTQPKGVYIYRLLNAKGESVSNGRLVVE